ncbi:MAG: (2Fe-2S)-binding protein [Acidobacteria bacterium]|nr:(2Fe-2S)-binding protein [Acidobacteriota bacterium]
MSISLCVIVNGNEHHLDVAPHHTLLDALREELGLTGTKRGCEVGDCGACTVLLNGKAVNSCLVLAAETEGAEVVTIEGVAGREGLHPLQEAFIREGAVQCGFCTPGMILSALALLRENPRPSDAEVRQALSGNLCRCTGYAKIVQAVLDASDASLVPGFGRPEGLRPSR